MSQQAEQRQFLVPERQLPCVGDSRPADRPEDDAPAFLVRVYKSVPQLHQRFTRVRLAVLLGERGCCLSL